MIFVDKIVVFDVGCVVQVGKLLEFYYYLVDCFVVGFIGLLKMNFLLVKVIVMVIDQVQVELLNCQ